MLVACELTSILGRHLSLCTTARGEDSLLVECGFQFKAGCPEILQQWISFDQSIPFFIGNVIANVNNCVSDFIRFRNDLTNVNISRKDRHNCKGDCLAMVTQGGGTIARNILSLIGFPSGVTCATLQALPPAARSSTLFRMSYLYNMRRFAEAGWAATHPLY